MAIPFGVTAMTTTVSTWVSAKGFPVFGNGVVVELAVTLVQVVQPQTVI